MDSSGIQEALDWYDMVIRLDATEMRKVTRKSRKPYKPTPPVPDGHKYCHRCKQIKAHADFSINRNKMDGLGSECRQCMKDRYQERNPRD